MNPRVLKIHPDDNVIVALEDIARGTSFSWNGNQFEIVEDIPAKHKFFMGDMQLGDEVIMYGVLVGKAQQSIPIGSRMSTSNVKHAADPYQYRGSNYQWKAPDV